MSGSGPSIVCLVSVRAAVALTVRRERAGTAICYCAVRAAAALALEEQARALRAKASRNGRRPFAGEAQLRSATYAHQSSGRCVLVSPVEQWAWGEQIRQRDDDGEWRVYRRCTGVLYGTLLRSMRVERLAALRAALVACHGEALVAQVEATFLTAVAA